MTSLLSSGREQGGVGVGGRSQQGQGQGPEGREPAPAFDNPVLLA